MPSSTRKVKSPKAKLTKARSTKAASKPTTTPKPTSSPTVRIEQGRNRQGEAIRIEYTYGSVEIANIQERIRQAKDVIVEAEEQLRRAYAAHEQYQASKPKVVSTKKRARRTK